MGVAGRVVGLGALLTPVVSHAYSYSYVSKSNIILPTDFTVGSQTWVFQYTIFKNALGGQAHYLISKRKNTADPYIGIKYNSGQSTAEMITDAHFSNLVATGTTKGFDGDTTNWHDTGVRRRTAEVNWNLPTDATSVVHYEVHPDDSLETVINAVSYFSTGTYYLKYTFRDHILTTTGGWVTRAITRVSGTARTDIITRINTLKDKAYALRIAKGVGVSTAAVAAGGILAGASVQGVMGKAAIPYWVMAAGGATFLIGGVGATAGYCLASQACITAAADLLVKCEEHFGTSFA